MSPHTDPGALLKLAEDALKPFRDMAEVIECSTLGLRDQSDKDEWDFRDCPVVKLGDLRAASKAWEMLRQAASQGSADDLREQLHYMTGTCELAMKHRDIAEHALEVALADNPSGPIDKCRWIALLERAEAAEAKLAASQGREAGEVAEHVLVPKSALAWLNGEAPDADGKWFGDGEDESSGNMRRKYWWRSKFRALCESATVAQAGLDPSRDDLIESIRFAIGEISEHIDTYHDFDYAPHQVPPELEELRRLQHHLEGSLINSKGEAVAVPSAQGSSPKERGNRFCKHDDCPYPDCLVEGVCPSQPAEDVAK